MAETGESVKSTAGFPKWYSERLGIVRLNIFPNLPLFEQLDWLYAWKDGYAGYERKHPVGRFRHKNAGIGFFGGEPRRFQE
jgi:hypothetical protein